MEEKIKSFKDLKIWQKGIEIVKDVYTITRSFPNEEMYGLTSQMRRSAVSIPSNVAEGFRRFHNKEFAQFLHIAFGSAAELETQLIIAEELKYFNSENNKKIFEKISHLSKMIKSLLKKLNTTQ